MEDNLKNLAEVFSARRIYAKRFKNRGRCFRRIDMR